MQETAFLRLKGTVVSMAPFSVMILVKISILLKMIHPAKNIKNFLEYSRRIRMPAPSEAEIRLFKTTKTRQLSGFVDMPAFRLWVTAIKVAVPMAISVSPKKGMNFLNMGWIVIRLRQSASSFAKILSFLASPDEDWWS